MKTSEQHEEWKSTACVLCESNCGVRVKVDNGELVSVRGDRSHPGSKGYTCEKALRLAHYQSVPDRLLAPLRRTASGEFEKVDWDTAIEEIAARFAEIRDAYGGASIFSYGGGGQGNHLGGVYGSSTLAALGSVFRSNALAQEKTGEMWVDGRLYGGHTRGDFERAEVAVFVGKNPWQSHGISEARRTLNALSNDAARSLVVIDPRRSETAAIADFHLQVRPGTDVFCLAALLGVIVQEKLVDETFVEQHVSGSERVLAVLAGVPVEAFAHSCGVAESTIRQVARRIASADSVSVFEDLGVQQAPFSTLNSYLEKLVWILTGNYAKPGAMHIHTVLSAMAKASSSPDGRSKASPVAGAKIIGGLVPCNVIADEILTDDPARYRAMLVESANPAHSLADSKRFGEALDALDFLVVIDVAMTETCRHADYVLPATTQFEKYEATFFNFEFPRNVFHLRQPVIEPPLGPLAEPEIHRRLVRALGALTDDDVAPLQAAARKSRAAFADAFLKAISEPRLAAVASVLLLESLGPQLPDGAAPAAALWGAAQQCALAFPEQVRRAGFEEPDDGTLGDALFDAILASPSGLTFTVSEHDEAWESVRRDDRRFTIEIASLLDELEALRPTDAAVDPAWPLILAAGERRSSTANTIYRDPSWRKDDHEGALRVHPDDATAAGLDNGDSAQLSTRTGSAVVVVEVDPDQHPGRVSLPNGFGTTTAADGTVGVAPNELTSTDDCDPIAATPWHKHIPARLTTFRSKT